MVEWFRRAADPVLRLTTMRPVAHDEVFAEFARVVGQVALEERVRNEPRVVSFRQKRGVL
ncbi:hypothetical protein [Acuticoccus yangtzensis]|uniref:hypothetical protein n=1 Tax=Acuticoccus yangtzensis TaxID=1443441 RepID=UPI00094996C5|nr:hypothetical protein [Acuticoccus yangtzensis]